MSGNNQDIMATMLHAAGRGYSTVPASGAGFFDKVRGFAKRAYQFAAPHVQKHAVAFGKDILQGLSQSLNTDKRMVEL